MSALELVAGPITQPCVPSHVLTLGFAGCIALCLGVFAVCYAWGRLREAGFGRRLLEACAGDELSANKHVENIRRENDVLDDVFVGVLRAPHPSPEVCDDGFDLVSDSELDAHRARLAKNGEDRH